MERYGAVGRRRLGRQYRMWGGGDQDRSQITEQIEKIDSQSLNDMVTLTKLGPYRRFKSGLPAYAHGQCEWIQSTKGARVNQRDVVLIQRKDGEERQGLESASSNVGQPVATEINDLQSCQFVQGTCTKLSPVGLTLQYIYIYISKPIKITNRSYSKSTIATIPQALLV